LKAEMGMGKAESRKQKAEISEGEKNSHPKAQKGRRILDRINGINRMGGGKAEKRKAESRNREAETQRVILQEWRRP
ncbi:MAG: hypothetical protein R6V03_03500, partial [Kiritimatiellia bacterium]